MASRVLLVLLALANIAAGTYICDSVLWGTFQDDIYSSTIVNESRAFDTAVGRSSQIFHVYLNWDEGDQGPNGNDLTQWYPLPGWIQAMSSYTAAGLSNRVPLITWQPWHSPYVASNNYYTFSAITSGQYDTYINSFFKVVKGLGPLVYVRLAHEFDGNWYPWGAVNGNTGSSYQAMWQHVWKIGQAANATNVKWVWCPNNSNGNGVYFEDWYPGNSYVDWVCLDAYADNAAVSFAQTITTAASPANPYPRLLTLTNSQKPVMIAEFGATTSTAGSYAAWFAAMTASLQTSFPQIKAAVLFNSQSYKMPTSNTTFSYQAQTDLTGAVGGSCTPGGSGALIRGSGVMEMPMLGLTVMSVILALYGVLV